MVFQIRPAPIGVSHDPPHCRVPPQACRGFSRRASFLVANRALKDIPGVNAFELLRQVSPKNDFTFGVSMEFADEVAYQGYNNHPAHGAFVRDRWVPEAAGFMEIDYVALPE